MKFKGGKAVTLLSNGCIIHQPNEVKRILDDNSKVVGESQILQGRKIILLKEQFGVESEVGEHQDDKKKERHIALHYDQEGYATIVGIFNDFKQEMSTKLDQFAKAYADK